MTYLEIVNKVLRRLRENEVGSVSSTNYSRLIGDLVNDVKTEVESAWNWNALRYSFEATTEAGTFNYALVGATQGSRILNAWNDTTNIKLEEMTTDTAERRFQHSRNPSVPMAYNINGMDDDGNLLVDLWAIPDGAYNVSFNMFVPQPTLVNDGAVIRVPWVPVLEGAVARAVQERGDDGGIGADIQNLRYTNALADAIASDAALHQDEVTWTPV